jgi:hypothetical protein
LRVSGFAFPFIGRRAGLNFKERKPSLPAHDRIRQAVANSRRVRPFDAMCAKHVPNSGMDGIHLGSSAHDSEGPGNGFRQAQPAVTL